ncbi:MAG: CehA/McbA family metallohydrolase [Planctomycetota bacterium]
MKSDDAAPAYGAQFRRVDLDGCFNWPEDRAGGEWWMDLAERVRGYAEGEQRPWGIPFTMGRGRRRRVLLVRGGQEAAVPVNGRADYLCLLHEWPQLPEDVDGEDPTEGLVVAEYELGYADGGRHVQPVRGRFEVAMEDSAGPAWLARGFEMWEAVDPAQPPSDMQWGRAQPGVRGGRGAPAVYALPNPHPEKELARLTVRGLKDSPLIVAGLTLCRCAEHPLRHLPRRTYRLEGAGGGMVEEASVDMGGVVRLEDSVGPPDAEWLDSPHAGLHPGGEEGAATERLIEAFGAADATVSVKLGEAEDRLHFSLGRAFHQGRSADASGSASLRVLGRQRRWMTVEVRDASTGRPTPARVHLRGEGGEYIAPYGHHSQVNANWFEDYGADVVAGGRQYAYVPGRFRTDLPVGDLYVEVNKGFEYRPVRRRVTVEPGQEVLELEIERGLDWRSRNWVTADTHVHFISPHTAWLEGQAEGVNVVNLLASQWGRLFTNVGDYVGGPNVVGDDTIVYVGTENRNHMLGHMSMLGTGGDLPVFPMCCGGPSESFVGDPDFMLLADWARQNRNKGGLAIRPHFPFCGFTEDPVPILQGLVDALEVRPQPREEFPVQEWYRYLNCGYRVSVVGGTDKMGAYCPIGWMRTYALIDPERPFDYANWADAVRAGRTFTTNGPLIDIAVEGKGPGESLDLPASGGTLQVHARAESVWPLGKIEIVRNGRVVAEREADQAGAVELKARVEVPASGWIAARCSGRREHAAKYLAAHTSPVYLKCGQSRAFDGPAAEHMLALVEGGVEYLNTLATVFDEGSRKRMARQFKEARAELRERLRTEGGREPHHGAGGYHTHGHGAEPDHAH